MSDADFEMNEHPTEPTEATAEQTDEAGLLRDQLLRERADFANFRRRSYNELVEAGRQAQGDLIAKLLTTLDNLERAIESAEKSGETGSLYDGIKLTQASLSRALESVGLTPIESVGQPFDVHRHEAIQQVEQPDAPPHTVVFQVEKGYTLGDRVLRHAKVVVSGE